MKKGFLLLLMSVLTALGFAAPYELTVTPGNLKNLLRDKDIEPEELVLLGSLNSEDLIFIREGEGRISRLKNLDLSKITLSYDDGLYASFQWTNYVGNSEITENFLLSDNIRTESTSGTGPLGMGYVIINHYTNDLSAFLYGNQNIRILTLPEAISEFGPYICEKSMLEEVTFPNSTTLIPNSAFASTPIQKVIGKGVTKIGNNAFESSAIQEFNFDNINELGTSSFTKSKLKGDLTLSGIEVIPAYCFAETEITNVTIKNGTKEIGENAFAGCSSLTKATLPDGIETLGNGAFNSYYLSDINLPNSLVEIGSNALPEKFVNNMPEDDGVVYIGKIAYCIGSCPSTILRIKEGTLSISNGFSKDKGGTYNTSITKIILPSSLTTIENSVNSYTGAFYNMSSLEEVEFSVTSNLKQLGSGAFYGCGNLKSINLPEGLLSLGNNAFSRCISLQTVYLPNSLERIGDETFMTYDSNNNIEIQNFPDNLQYIGKEAFSGCRMPSTITLGQNIKEIKGSAFYNITGCYTLNLDLNKDYKYSDEYGNEYYSIFGDSSLEKVNIKSTCEIIPPKFFGNCQNLEIVNFENPDDQQVPLKIYSSAFSNGKINIDQLPIRITEIGSNAFSGVKFQQKEFNSSNITFIGKEAFYESTGFEKVILEGDLEECWVGAFSSIGTLTEVKYNLPELKTYDLWWGEMMEGVSLFSGSPINKIEVGKDVDILPKSIFAYLNGSVSDIIFEPRENNNLLTIGESAFYGCGIGKLYLPEFPINIGPSAFYDSSLTELDLGGTVRIEAEAFGANYSLNSVKIPSTVEYIGSMAFGSNVSYPLYNLTFESREETKTPLEIANYAFERANIIDLILPDVPTIIGNRAFYRNSINELHLGIGTTTIGDEAFQYNTSLFDINIPQTVTYIGDNAFYKGSGNVATIYFYSEFPPEMGYSIVYPGTVVVAPEKSLDKYQDILGTCYPYDNEVLSFSNPKINLEINKETYNYVTYTEDIFDGMPWIIENSNPEVVSITLESGVMKLNGLNNGYAEITARLIYNENITTKCIVVVGDYSNVESVSFVQEKVTLTVNEELQLDLIVSPEDAIYSDITWESSDSNIVTVSQTGKILAIQPGTVVITAFVDGLSANCEVTVEKTYVGAEWISIEPSFVSIRIGESYQITANVYPEETSDKIITWSSSNPDIAEVTENGVITGISLGTAKITAACGDVSSDCEVEVTYQKLLSFLLDPNGAVMDIGDEIQLNIIVEPENAVYPPVEWSSSNNSVASVSDSGLVKGVGEGECVIAASCDSFEAFCYITVNPDAGVESILANPASNITIYTVEGILIKKDCKVEDLKTLNKGIYIIVSGKEHYKISI